MMKSMKLTTLAIAAVFLLGCEVTGPSVKVEPPKVKVDGVKVEDGSSKGGDFCPPGQRKKGNC
jgi:hypothetical protein